MSDSVSSEELERKKEEESKKRSLSVTRRKSALVKPEEQQRIIDAFCQQFKGIIPSDKEAVPTLKQVIEQLEKSEGITRDPKNRSVYVPQHKESTRIEQAVYAAVLVLMATSASSLVSPSGGQPQELFSLATAVIASNAAIAKEQINTVVDTLKAGKSSLTAEAQTDLDTVIAVVELNSQLITEANSQGKTLSEAERRAALLQAIASSDKFPDPESKKKATDIIAKYDARFSAVKLQLAKPTGAPTESFSAAVIEPRPAPSSTPKPEVKGPEASIPVGGDRSSPVEAKDKKKKQKEVEETKAKARPVRSASVGDKPHYMPPFLSGTTLPRPHGTPNSGQEMKLLDTEALSKLTEEELKAYGGRLEAEKQQCAKEEREVFATFHKAKAAGHGFPLQEKLEPINAKKEVLVKYDKEYQDEVSRRESLPHPH